MSDTSIAEQQIPVSSVLQVVVSMDISKPLNKPIEFVAVYTMEEDYMHEQTLLLRKYHAVATSGMNCFLYEVNLPDARKLPQHTMSSDHNLDIIINYHDLNLFHFSYPVRIECSYIDSNMELANEPNRLHDLTNVQRYLLLNCVVSKRHFFMSQLLDEDLKEGDDDAYLNYVNYEYFTDNELTNCNEKSIGPIEIEITVEDDPCDDSSDEDGEHGLELFITNLPEGHPDLMGVNCEHDEGDEEGYGDEFESEEDENEGEAAAGNDLNENADAENEDIAIGRAVNADAESEDAVNEDAESEDAVNEDIHEEFDVEDPGDDDSGIEDGEMEDSGIEEGEIGDSELEDGEIEH